MVEAFIEELKNEQLSSNTIEAYERDLRQFLNFVERTGKRTGEINGEEIDGFRASLKGRALPTINRKMISLRRYLSFTGLDPTRAKTERMQNQQYLDEQKVLGKNEIQRMVEKAQEEEDWRAVALFSTLAYTGGRVSEILQLSLKDFERDAVMIRGKGKKYRELFLPLNLRKILKTYVGQGRMERGEALFTGERGAINRQTVDRIIKKYAYLCQIHPSKAHAHAFRHHVGRSLAESQVPIDQIADILGHSDINTTRIYMRATKGDLLNRLNSL